MACATAAKLLAFHRAARVITGTPGRAKPGAIWQRNLEERLRVWSRLMAQQPHLRRASLLGEPGWNLARVGKGDLAGPVHSAKLRAALS